ncbi:hypothetical protein ACQXXY_12390 [Corynebacterium diphtheriae]
MSTEQKLVAVVDAANDLTKMIAAKIGDIDLKVQQAVMLFLKQYEGRWMLRFM